MKREENICNAAYAIVCKMIDLGFIESTPEGDIMQEEIQKILKQYFK